jgi:endoribonuclease Dicer
VGGEALFDNVLRPFYDRHITLKTLSHHPTKILFELFQAHGCQQFQIVKEKNHESPGTRCDGTSLSSSCCDRLTFFLAVIVHEVILASATDTTVTFAARKASFFALDALEGDAEFLIRECDCRSNAQSKKAQKGADDVLSRLQEDEALPVEGSLSQGNLEKPDVDMI